MEALQFGEGMVQECWASEDFGKGELVLPPSPTHPPGLQMSSQDTTSEGYCLCPSLWKCGPVKVTSMCKRHLAPHPLCPGAKSPWILLLGGSNCSGMATRTSVGAPWDGKSPLTTHRGSEEWAIPTSPLACSRMSITPGAEPACLQQPLAKKVWDLNSPPPCQAIPGQLNEWNSSRQIYKMHTGLCCIRKYHPILTLELYRLCFQPLQMTTSLLVSLQVQRVY